MTPSRITYTPAPLSWWRRLLRLGPPASELQADLQSCIKVANRNADIAERLDAQRNVAWPKPERRLQPPQLRAAFDVPVTEPLFTAVMQTIDDELQVALDQVSLPPSAQITESQRLHLAGGIEALRILQKKILDARADAQRRDAELEEPAATR